MIEQSKKKDSHSNAKALFDEFAQETKGSKIMSFEGDYMPLLVNTDWFRFCDNNKKQQLIAPTIWFKKGHHTKAYVDDDKYIISAETGITTALADKKWFDWIKKEYEKTKKTIDQAYKSYNPKNMPSAAEMIKQLGMICSTMNSMVAYTLMIERLDKSITQKALRQFNPKIDIEKVWDASLTLPFISIASKSSQAIIDFVESGKKDLFHIKHAIVNYTLIPTDENCRKEISSMNIPILKKEVVEARKKAGDNKRKLALLRKSFTLPEREALDYLLWTAHTRDERREFINKAHAIYCELGMNLYHLWGVDEELLKVSMVCEIIKGKEFVLSIIDDLKKRVSSCMMLYYDDSHYKQENNYPDEYIALLDKQIADENKSNNEGILKGETGSRGKVSGRIRKIMTVDEFHKFQKGEILLTVMTRPEFVSLMKKAAAIITDEGGLTSHAAIISRELKKPCIIGTKIATQLFKDGDLVEVDADKGIVRRL